MSKLLREQLETKFGRLPRWAGTRLVDARPAQVERWGKKILSADTLEDVFGPRHRNTARRTSRTAG